MNEPDAIARAGQVFNSSRPLIIGHRGFCAVAPENTLPSFQLALDAGADLVELDYHQTRDGVPIVVHDHTLDRTTDARRQWRQRRIRVADRTVTEIQSLDAGSWFNKRFVGTRMPRLTEALDLICGRGSIAVIEHKSGDAETLVGLLRERKVVSQVVVISFNWRFLQELHGLAPDLLLGALGRPERLATGRRPTRLVTRLDKRWLEELAKTKARLAVWNWNVSRRSVRLAHELGLNVWVYTVNDVRRAKRLADIGVDGIITNRPPQIRQAFGK